jgi:hypothetical protein
MLTLFLFLACESSASDPAGFQGGDFQFTTTGVDDQCNDGAFDVIFMPEGTPEDFETPIEIPSTSDLPATYTIDLQDPFTEMQVTVDAGASEDQMEALGATQTGVELDADSWPGCLVDASIDIYLTIIDDNTLEGSAALHTSSYDEDSCPAVSADTCDIKLDLSAARI